MVTDGFVMCITLDCGFALCYYWFNVIGVIFVVCMLKLLRLFRLIGLID